MLRSLAVLVAVLAPGLALMACAPGNPGSPAAPGERAPRQCFQTRQVINFREGEPQRIYLRVQAGEVFQVSAAGCLDFGSSHTLSITPATGINDRLCVGDSARIAGLNPTLQQTPCLARIDRVLTPAEVEALPSRQRP